MIIGDNSRVVAYSYSTVNVGIKGVGTIFRVEGGGGGKDSHNQSTIN